MVQDDVGHQVDADGDGGLVGEEGRRVDGRRLPVGGDDAEVEHHGRGDGPERAEVLAAHLGLLLDEGLLRAQDALGRGQGAADEGRVVVDRLRAELVGQVEGRPGGLADARHEAGDLLPEDAALVLAVVSHGGLEPGRAGDDVGGRSGVEGPHRDDRVVPDVRLPGDDGLEGGDDLGADDDRIDAGPGAGPVAALRPDLEREAVDVGRHEARGVADAAGLERVVDVVGEEGPGDDVLERALPDHQVRPAAALLGGLGDEHDRAGQVGLHRRQHGRDAEEHRGVDVVTAGVHEPGLPAVDDGFLPRGEGQAGLLRDRQGVHVAAHGHDGTGLAALEDPDDARLGVARPDLEAELAEIIGDDAGRARFLEAELRVAVDVLADGDELGGELIGRGLDLLRQGRRGSRRRPQGSRGEQDEEDRERDGERATFHEFLLRGRGGLW